MRHLREAGGGRHANPARGTVGADQLGKARFDRVVALAQFVVLRVADLGRVFRVIKLVVMRDLLRQAFELGGGFGFGQPVDRDLGETAHACAPAMRLAAAARASAVMVEPDSIRAISSCLVSGSSSSTRVTALFWRSSLATRQ